MNGITYIDHFINHPEELFDFLKSNVSWDERMAARKTASFGRAYNYSQMSYPYQEFPEPLKSIINGINDTHNFEPNNCLINYYLDGTSKMGFHSDQTDILEMGTGVAIISIGAVRTLRFRNIADQAIIHDFDLQSGSLIYMTNEVQNEWQHAIPKSDTQEGRMSLTFRKIIA
ncbi:alpha-ketoglutarate-dependent dioxygenase AlkB [Fulvivirga ligni]|uniref:alpha-ketoglutarate-dependent dioxygenase AlkB n=1 Tax=Fulvivirga ligni TaxID=2904246 RepID=UPI001F1F94F7|nr:alpha-ketoglutarate-dependent dioxygenase AlkB [Fulvivirga ligni]UII19881.1 alpha-ketoglutarate-dependent dioxygenase AlkB [Fulvivirga ligni]